VPQNQVQQNEFSQVFSTENQTQDINSNLPNNSEICVERREQQIHEQSQQKSDLLQNVNGILKEYNAMMINGLRG